MAAPIESYVQLPLDTGNTGKMVRAQSRVVGANTVYTHQFVPITGVSLRSVYSTDRGISQAASAQNGTSTGNYWFQNPIDSNVNARLRKISLMTGNLATSDVAASPRVFFARTTFTGTFTGSLTTITRRSSSEKLNQCDVRTASTGASVSLGNPFWSITMPGFDVTTSGNVANGIQIIWQPLNEDEFIEFAQGEGFVCYQADAGSAGASTLVSVLMWDEYDIT